MSFKMDPNLEAKLAAQINRVAQEAADVTSRAHHEQGVEDVEGRLREELEARGLHDLDEEWVRTIAGNIREGQVVFITSDDEVGTDED